jgi:hypothetical protein
MPLLLFGSHWNPLDPVGKPLEPLVSHVEQYIGGVPGSSGTLTL